ncbi:MAG: hypothetical protein U0838_12715 [Chloroflexota bacterium]
MRPSGGLATAVVDVGPDPLADGRPAALDRGPLTRGQRQHALARAELEALAGRGRLDDAALLDLAEVRWRTGDLGGAGDAAARCSPGARSRCWPS